MKFQPTPTPTPLLMKHSIAAAAIRHSKQVVGGGGGWNGGGGVHRRAIQSELVPGWGASRSHPGSNHMSGVVRSDYQRAEQLMSAYCSPALISHSAKVRIPLPHPFYIFPGGPSLHRQTYIKPMRSAPSPPGAGLIYLCRLCQVQWLLHY